MRIIAALLGFGLLSTPALADEPGGEMAVREAPTRSVPVRRATSRVGLLDEALPPLNPPDYTVDVRHYVLQGTLHTGVVGGWTVIPTAQLASLGPDRAVVHILLDPIAQPGAVAIAAPQTFAIPVALPAEALNMREVEIIVIDRQGNVLHRETVHQQTAMLAPQIQVLPRT